MHTLRGVGSYWYDLARENYKQVVSGHKIGVVGLAIAAALFSFVADLMKVHPAIKFAPLVLVATWVLLHAPYARDKRQRAEIQSLRSRSFGLSLSAIQIGHSGERLHRVCVKLLSGDSVHDMECRIVEIRSIDTQPDDVSRALTYLRKCPLAVIHDRDLPRKVVHTLHDGPGVEFDLMTENTEHSVWVPLIAVADHPTREIPIGRYVIELAITGTGAKSVQKEFVVEPTQGRRLSVLEVT